MHFTIFGIPQTFSIFKLNNEFTRLNCNWFFYSTLTVDFIFSNICDKVDILGDVTVEIYFDCLLFLAEECHVEIISVKSLLVIGKKLGSSHG